jgi:DNA-binding cell septation regulator SpoVG
MQYGFAQIKITDVRFSAARDDETAAGLIGWVSCVLNGNIHLDGVAVRRTADGRHVLSFPARRDAGGYQHFFIRPIGNVARMEIEAQVFRALGIDQEK